MRNQRHHHRKKMRGRFGNQGYDFPQQGMMWNRLGMPVQMFNPNPMTGGWGTVQNQRQARMMQHPQPHETPKFT